MTDQEILKALERQFAGQSALAARLTRETGTGVTRQRISNWKVRGIPHSQRLVVVRLYGKEFGLSEERMIEMMEPQNGQ